MQDKDRTESRAGRGCLMLRGQEKPLNDVASLFLNSLFCMVCMHKAKLWFILGCQDKLQELYLSFNHVGSEGQTQVTRLGSKHLYQLSHVCGLWFLFCFRLGSFVTQAGLELAM